VKRCDLVIDIGSAEGYFAIGIARLGKRVIAFDADPHERRICKVMASLNEVSERLTRRRDQADHDKASRGLHGTG
jgi:FkbM family methyltransferase